MTMGEKIKNRRIELGLTVDQVAEKLHINRATVYRYENNSIEEMSISVVKTLAKVLHVTPQYLMGWSDENHTSTLPNGVLPIKRKRFPMVGKVSCGVPIIAEQQFDTFVDGTDINADCCVQAQGDSMINARILDGDTVFIRQQEMVNNGEIAAVVIDDSITLKRVYYYPDKGKMVLQSENPNYEPLVYVGEELNQIHIYGKAVAFQSNIK
jgi:repressor LexA